MKNHTFPSPLHGYRDTQRSKGTNALILKPKSSMQSDNEPTIPPSNPKISPHKMHQSRCKTSMGRTMEKRLDGSQPQTHAEMTQRIGRTKALQLNIKQKHRRNVSAITYRTLRIKSLPIPLQTSMHTILQLRMCQRNRRTLPSRMPPIPQRKELRKIGPGKMTVDKLLGIPRLIKHTM
jgi:hypothetical protein